MNRIRRIRKKKVIVGSISLLLFTITVITIAIWINNKNAITEVSTYKSKDMTQSLATGDNVDGSWDVSKNGDGSVTAVLYSDGKMVISGKGDMKDYYSDKVPYENEIDSILSVEIQDGVTSIGVMAFYDCYSLTSISIPSSVTSIGWRAFYECESLTSISIPSSVTSIGETAFYDCKSLTSISIPSSVTSIGGSVFEDCSSLTSISIPSSVTSIGDYAFKECSSLTSISIPSSVTSIGDSAFYNCRSLTSIEIPSSVTSIGDYTFYGCESLTSISIPSSVTSIGDSAFFNCSSLTSINVGENNKNYSSENGILFNKNKTEIIKYPEGKKDVTTFTIPSSVTSIGDYAFYWCRSLTSISIPSSVTSIGDSVFFGCSSLTSISIPSSVTSIGDYTFYGCESLTSISIPNSVTSIGDDAFAWCSSLTIYCKSNSKAYEYANTKKIAYKIYYDIKLEKNGGQGGKGKLYVSGGKIYTNSTCTTELTSDKSIDIPNKNGYKFNGYYYNGKKVISSEGKIIYIDDLIAITDDCEITAKYFPIYIANLETNGGKSEISKLYVVNNKLYADAECTTELTSDKAIKIPNKKGYKFNGYYYNGKKVISSEGKIIYIDDLIAITDDCEITAKYKPVYTANFDFDGGKNGTTKVYLSYVSGISDLKMYSDEACTQKINEQKIKVPEKEGYKFISYKLGDYEGTSFDSEGKLVESLSGNLKGTIETLISAGLEEGASYNLKAVWEKVEIPTIVTVGGRPTNWTKNDVTLTVIATTNKVKLAENAYSFDNGLTWQKENTKTYTENTNGINIKVKNVEGNTATYPTINITQIDKKAPTVNVTGNPTEWTNKEVTLTVNAKDNLSGLASEAYSFDNGTTWQKENTKIYTENTNGIVIKVKDNLGNIATHEAINITKIDKKIPTIESITGNPAEWTNKDVTLTVNASDDLSGLASEAYSFDNGTTWQKDNKKTYTENTNGIVIKVRDNAGNISNASEKINITKIDKKSPTISSVNGNLTNWTRENVTLTVNASDDLSGLASEAYSFDNGATWQKDNKKTYTENTNGIVIKAKDNLGNIAIYETINITKIDKQAPTITSVTGNPTEWANKDVTLTINAKDDLSGLASEAYSFDNGATWQKDNKKTYTENTNGIVIKVKDNLGNIATYETINITKIDKKIPTIESITGNPAEWTNKDVTLTVNAKDDVSGLASEAYSFDNGATWQKDNKKTYTENTNGIIIKVRDNAGNISNASETINITKIDKKAPVIKDVKLSEQNNESKIIVTIEATDELSGLASEAYSFDNGTTWQKDNTKTYTEGVAGVVIKVRDIAGNIETREIGEIKIDKQAPTITSVTGNPTNWTKENVTLTVNAKDDLSGLASEAYSFDNGATWQKDNTKTYTENTSGIVIKVKDNLGNIATHETINITKIDKQAPTISSVAGNPANWTKENVTLTVNASDELSGLANEAYSFDNGVTWQKDNKKTYTENKNGIIIKVRDNVGNITTHETINITKIKKEEITITGIEIKTNPTKTAYYEGEKLDTTGLKLTIKYSNNTTKEVTEGYTCTPTELNTIGTQKITVTHSGKTTTFNVTVSKVIDTSEYTVENNRIKSVKTKTTLTDFKKNIKIGGTTRILNKNGKEISDTELITTGTKIETTINNKTTTYTVVVTGDANGDGQADIKDIMLINKHRLNKAQLKNEYLTAGDVNNDGKVDFRDLLQINKYRLGKIKNL